MNNDLIKQVMSELGKKSVEARRKDPQKMKEWAKNAAKARWKKRKP